MVDFKLLLLENYNKNIRELNKYYIKILFADKEYICISEMRIDGENKIIEFDGYNYNESAYLFTNYYSGEQRLNIAKSMKETIIISYDEANFISGKVNEISIN